MTLRNKSRLQVWSHKIDGTLFIKKIQHTFRAIFMLQYALPVKR